MAVPAGLLPGMAAISVCLCARAKGEIPSMGVLGPAPPSAGRQSNTFTFEFSCGLNVRKTLCLYARICGDSWGHFCPSFRYGTAY